MIFDMAKLKNLKKLDGGSPQVMSAFRAFDKAVFREGEISVLNKQLTAVAVALTTQCSYCIGIQTKEARKARATDAQRAETAAVAAAIRAGGAITHALCSLKARSMPHGHYCSSTGRLHISAKTWLTPN